MRVSAVSIFSTSFSPGLLLKSGLASSPNFASAALESLVNDPATAAIGLINPLLASSPSKSFSAASVLPSARACANAFAADLGSEFFGSSALAIVASRQTASATHPQHL